MVRTEPFCLFADSAISNLGTLHQPYTCGWSFRLVAFSATSTLHSLGFHFIIVFQSCNVVSHGSRIYIENQVLPKAKLFG